MPNQLFSTYTHGENRVMSTFLAALELRDAGHSSREFPDCVDPSRSTVARVLKVLWGSAGCERILPSIQRSVLLYMNTERITARLVTVGLLAVAIVEEAVEMKIKYPAATMAYYGFVSLLPLLLLVVAVVGTVFEADVLDAISGFAAQYLTPDARQLIVEGVITASGRTGAAVLAVVVFGWGATNAVLAFLDSLERVEGVSKRPLSRQFRDGIIVLATIGLATLATITTGILVAVLSIVPLGPLSPATVTFAPIILFVLLTLAFVPLYYIPSQVVVSPLKALPGAIVAATGWTVLQLGVQFYASNAGQYALYGVLSGIIVVLTAFYFGAFVLLLGTVVNATLQGTNDERKNL